jgi:hypothetical protein
MERDISAGGMPMCAHLTMSSNKSKRAFLFKKPTHFFLDKNFLFLAPNHLMVTSIGCERTRRSHLSVDADG